MFFIVINSNEDKLQSKKKEKKKYGKKTCFGGKIHFQTKRKRKNVFTKIDDVNETNIVLVDID